jgi:hypothetical protein
MPLLAWPGSVRIAWRWVASVARRRWRYSSPLCAALALPPLSNSVASPAARRSISARISVKTCVL